MAKISPYTTGSWRQITDIPTFRVDFAHYI